MTSNHLENLQQIGLLDEVPFSPDLLDKMLNVAQSRLRDAMRADLTLAEKHLR